MRLHIQLMALLQCLKGSLGQTLTSTAQSREFEIVSAC